MSEKTRVLFVDDDAFLLQAQRRMLWGIKEWETEFVDSGEKTLAKMAEQSFDVVVSDMRMPIMDGRELLTEVQKLYPRTIRIILSGQTEQEEEIRSFGPAQRYLSKPCESAELRDVINRSITLQKSLSHDVFDRLTCDQPELLFLPKDIRNAIRLARVPHAQKSKISTQIEQNASFAEMFLVFANTSSCSHGETTQDVGVAIENLTWDALRPILLSAGCFAHVHKSRNDQSRLSDLVESSTRLGYRTLAIAQQRSATPQSSSYAMKAGLLHDLGELVFAQKFPCRHREVSSANSNEEKLAAQSAIFGLNQYQFAACLLQRWGLPNPVVEAIALANLDPINDAAAIHEQPIPVLALREALSAPCPAPLL